MMGGQNLVGLNMQLLNGYRAFRNVTIDVPEEIHVHETNPLCPELDNFGREVIGALEIGSGESGASSSFLPYQNLNNFRKWAESQSLGVALLEPSKIDIADLRSPTARARWETQDFMYEIFDDLKNGGLERRFFGHLVDMHSGEVRYGFTFVASSDLIRIDFKFLNTHPKTEAELSDIKNSPIFKLLTEHFAELEDEWRRDEDSVLELDSYIKTSQEHRKFIANRVLPIYEKILTNYAKGNLKDRQLDEIRNNLATALALDFPFTISSPDSCAWYLFFMADRPSGHREQLKEGYRITKKNLDDFF